MAVGSNDQGRRKVLGDTHPPKFADILTVDEAANLLRVNRKTLYEVIRLTCPLWAIRFGRTIRVSRTALLEAFRGKGGPALGDQQ